MNTTITATLSDGTEKTLTTTDINITRHKQLNMIKEVALKLGGEDEFLHITTMNGRATITLYERSDVQAFRNRMMQYNVMSITANNVTFTPNDGLATLNTFANSFTKEQAIQKEFLKANNLLATVELNRDGSFKSLTDSNGQSIITKSSEIMIPSFMSELKRAGIDAKTFTVAQSQKLASTLLDFVAATGKHLQQKQLLKTFIAYLNK
ncbi:hypothetical protein [Pseudoalteromonas sp. SCQQ13]|uniref:hypothetical protein n=1 Tax=Pseudoalteromonas sp. SCQQ13 TaxID=2792066 RepID=UPI0018CE4251|nr:hypothetical protein [Pseudoalteromonas sp. SCQQ13]MBH0093340.1 hypothetical protein [Pseudoalteromonas sp. SCQQ13]